MIVAVTGHRPPKIGGYSHDNPVRTWIRTALRESLRLLKAQRGITGMALGVDQDFAEVCIELGLPFTAAIPCDGQESRWPADSQEFYRKLITSAAEVVTVSPGPYAPQKMLTRNKWMVDQCDALIAVWDGSPGGTSHCHGYAVGIGCSILRIDPKERKISWNDPTQKK